jgi:hypothetical protein
MCATCAPATAVVPRLPRRAERHQRATTCATCAPATASRAATAPACCERHLALRRVRRVARRANAQFNCDFSDSSTYAYEHSKHCKELRLVAVVDTCEARRRALDGRVLHRRPCATFFKRAEDGRCSLRSNAHYFARYGLHEWTSLTVGKRAFIQSVSGEDLHFFGTFNVTETRVEFVDIGSTPAGRGCSPAADRGGAYWLEFEDKWCSIATVHTKQESCGARGVRFGDIRLEHVNICGNGIASACVACNDSDDDDDSWSSIVIVIIIVIFVIVIIVIVIIIVD